VYAELRNICDLAVVAALIRSEKLADDIGWEQLFFRDESRCHIDRGTAPAEVESVINHRVIDRRHLVVGVSGGVSVDAASCVRPNRIERDEYGLLQAEHAGATPADLPREVWWWD
jgi:hypothetical protein